MIGIYQRFTTAVLELVQPYSSSDHAPVGKVWPYIRSHLRPVKKALFLSLCVTILAASVEVWLISYAGTLIDTLAVTSRDDFLDTHGFTMLIAAVILLLFRPLSQMARHALNDIGLDCNVATLVRWRAHDHLSKQSVGWFQEDLTGRLVLLS